MAGLGVSQNQDIEYQYVVILTGKMMINQRMELFFMFFLKIFRQTHLLLAYHGIHTIETIETGYELSNFQHHPSGQFKLQVKLGQALGCVTG